MERQKVFELIDSEREYQVATWPNSKNLPATGEAILLKKYMRDFENNYQMYDDGEDIEVPFECLHDIRKMATILVRALENTPDAYFDLLKRK
jgi:hypothetical protein